MAFGRSETRDSERSGRNFLAPSSQIAPVAPFGSFGKVSFGKKEKKDDVKPIPTEAPVQAPALTQPPVSFGFNSLLTDPLAKYNAIKAKWDSTVKGKGRTSDRTDGGRKEENKAKTSTQDGLLFSVNEEKLINEDNIQAMPDDLLRRKVFLIKKRGKPSMPGGSAGGDGPSITLNSGNTMGLNFT